MNKKDEILKQLEEDLQNVKNSQEFVELRSRYLGKKGPISELTSNMKDLSVEEKREVGKLANEIRSEVEEKLHALEEEISARELKAKLDNETIDISLPSKKMKRGSRHPFNRIIEDV